LKLVDTNVLLDYPRIIENYDDIVLHISVLKELDNLKNKNQEVGKKARKASNLIFANKNKITFNKDVIRDDYVDDVLIYLAKKNKYIIVSNDINMLIKCEFENIESMTYSYPSDNYDGITRLEANRDNETIARIYEGGPCNLSLHENEYVFIYDENNVDIFKNKKNELIKCPYLAIDQTEYNEKVKPRNPEQRALIYTLLDKDNTIVFATGNYGTGKSYLLYSFALHELAKGSIEKIVIVPNNAQNENTRELGTLPGDMFSKEIVYMGQIIDIIGDSIEVERLYNDGLIEIMPIAVARGRNLENCIVIVNEAQNLTDDHIKLLIARCAEGTRIFFDGDVKQTDAKVFRDKNGLKLLTKLKDSKKYSDLFSMVRLESIERSRTAQAAQYLDEVE
jgi:predicted ribonuclease YlaK